MRTTAFAREDHFHKLIAESVDEGLTALLGSRANQVVYDCLQKRYSIKKEQIPDRLNDFGAALQQMFGKSSQTIGRILAKRLYSKLGLDFLNKSDYAFLDYVVHASFSTLTIAPE